MRAGDQTTAGPGRFEPSSPAAAATALDGHSVHLWWLPYQRERGRAPLLELLASYVGTDADALRLDIGAHGRPALAAPHRLDFNWSHSGGHALVALARGLPQLGVDVERELPHPRALALARRFFAADEHAALQRLPEARREVAFARLWTAKEAVLKAHGRGLGYGLHQVAFELADADVRALHFQGEVGVPGEWQLSAFRPHPQFQACVAWRGAPRRLLRFMPAA